MWTFVNFIREFVLDLCNDRDDFSHLMSNCFWVIVMSFSKWLIILIANQDANLPLDFNFISTFLYVVDFLLFSGIKISFSLAIIP